MHPSVTFVISIVFISYVFQTNVHLEVDEEGKVMGIEIWNAGKSGLIRQVTKAITKPT